MKVFCEENVLNQDYLLLHQKSHKNNLCDHVEDYFYYFVFQPEETFSFSLSAHRLCVWGRGEANHQSSNSLGNIRDLDCCH